MEKLQKESNISHNAEPMEESTEKSSISHNAEQTEKASISHNGEPMEESKEKSHISHNAESMEEARDEARVKILSPATLVMKRFFANPLALIGLVTIALMFLFSFLGGLLMPYDQSTVFFKYEQTVRDYLNAADNAAYQTHTVDGKEFPVMRRGALTSAIRKNENTFHADGADYRIGEISKIAKNGEAAFLPQAYLVFDSSENEALIATRMTVSPLEIGFSADYALIRALETALAAGWDKFTIVSGGKTERYQIENISVSPLVDDSFCVSKNGSPLFIYSTFVIRPVNPDTIVPVALRRALASAIAEQRTSFDYENESGESVHYLLSGVDGQWALKTEQSTHLVDVFGRPSRAHWLGTDGAGMDVVVRLMYGGRVSLLIGFAVIVIEVLLGVLLGGVAGYFGGIGDALLMRLVDVINCIPALPLYLIIGAFMDGADVDVHKRIYVLMLVMGFMSWPSVARVVRGQILSLREQEFMIAAEALGLSVFHRIFRHLVPNVIPQLIVLATMGLGNVILVESTLSFLGLGISFPLASWGNILNSVNDVFVMTNYFSVWIPAGFCILATVLAFNFIGDGLRDAFDPKMRR
ncbi:MAG: hypothetical protein Ta2A_14500 [Treponemataceae bacterium]|nr:MAG: hypothetical protein Ta2A_14500 [Treponemataceae bacterium]